VRCVRCYLQRGYCFAILTTCQLSVQAQDLVDMVTYSFNTCKMSTTVEVREKCLFAERCRKHCAIFAERYATTRINWLNYSRGLESRANVCLVCHDCYRTNTSRVDQWLIIVHAHSTCRSIVSLQVCDCLFVACRSCRLAIQAL
jgi:hypothetical protein